LAGFNFLGPGGFGAPSPDFAAAAELPDRGARLDAGLAADLAADLAAGLAAALAAGLAAALAVLFDDPSADFAGDLVERRAAGLGAAGGAPPSAAAFEVLAGFLAEDSFDADGLSPEGVAL